MVSISESIAYTLYGAEEAKVSALQLFKESINVRQAMVSALSNTGIAGFKFNIPEREQIKMQSEVTDHYIDTNDAVQDHIAKKPVEITLAGLEGEYFYSVNKIEDLLAKVAPVMRLAPAFIPRFQAATYQLKQFNKDYTKRITNLAEGKQNTANPNVNTWDKIGAAWDTLNGQDLFKTMQELYKLKSRQTRAFLFFEALWGGTEKYKYVYRAYDRDENKRDRTFSYLPTPPAIFTVETTFRRYDNMVITNLTPMRDNNADITEFSITFKQLNFTSSLVTNLENRAGRNRQQMAQMNNKGVDKGIQTSV